MLCKFMKLYTTKKNSNFIQKNRYISTQKVRVGVLMGGKSPENEVSFNSGRTVCDHLDSSLYTIVPIYQAIDGQLFILPWNFLHRGKTTDFANRLASFATAVAWDDLKELIDFMYIATHGNYAEDGTLQGFLELLGIPYLGAGIFASALRMDKIAHKQFLQSAGILVPRFVPLYPAQLVDKNKLTETIKDLLINAGITLPCIVKPHNQGSSIGISVAHTYEQLIEYIYKAALVTNKLSAVVIEEYIVGMEFSCITLVDYKNKQYLPLPPTEIVRETETDLYDYDQKYMPGRATKHTPARCAPEAIEKIQETCIRVMELLEFTTISRIDGFLTDDGNVIIFDPNSLSGMGPASFLFLQAAQIGMSHGQLINHLIKSELWQYDIATQEESLSMQNNILKKPKMRVAVLMGGQSHEKEISLESGRNVTYKLSTQKYTIIPLFMSSKGQLYKISQALLVHNSTTEIESLVKNEDQIKWAELPTIADFIFIALHGGVGENGSVQGALEMLNLPYNGSSVYASSLCINKWKTNKLLAQHGIATPYHTLVSTQDWATNKKNVLEYLTQQHPFPSIVKPHDDGCSVMVEKVHTIDALEKAIEAIFADGKTEALVEEFINGTELTVGVIGNENPHALPPSQCVTTQNILTIEEKFLPGAGENQTPALLPAEVIVLIQKTVVNAFIATQCKGYARIDCFYQDATQSPTKKERVVIIEINTLPGLTPATCLFHQAAEIGIKPMELLDKIIDYGLALHTNLSNSTKYNGKEIQKIEL